MIRQLLCRKCGEPYDLHRLDKREGFKMRKAFISTKVPQGHGLTINGVFTALSNLHCDLCNEVITGDIAVATTQWNSNREGEPRQWENEYGTILNDQSVQAHDALSKS